MRVTHPDLRVVRPDPPKKRRHVTLNRDLPPRRRSMLRKLVECATIRETRS